jgi:YVTN family beta-propeller protein
MKRIYLILFLLIFNIGFSQEYYVYVAAESDDQVSVLKFDGKEIQETDRVSVGVMPTENEGPHGITIDPNGKYWYLTLAHGNPNGSVVKYSTENNEPLSKVELGLFPATMQISKTTGLLYVVNFNLHGLMKTSTVSVVDPEYMVEISQIKTGIMPHGSRVSPDGNFHYSVAMMSGELFEIDAVDLSVKRILSLDTNKHHRNAMHHSKIKPTWVTPSPSGKELYIAGNGSDNIYIVDTEKWEVKEIYKTGKGPYNIAVSPNGEKLIATLKNEGAVTIWSLKNRKQI